MCRFFPLSFLWFTCLSTGLFAQDTTYTNSIGMEFVLIQPGSFVLGKFQPPYPQPSNAPQAENNNPDKPRGYHAVEYQRARELAEQEALPGFTVTISQPFYIGKFEVTQAQWKKVMGDNPSVFQGDQVSGDSDQHPVDHVSWQEAQTFIRKLNQMEDGTRHYRLPTEFEWEYAARAGAQEDIAWENIRIMAQLGGRTTYAVGQKQPNAWGLYDMLGNVWEWVQDYYNEKIFADSIPLTTGKEHVLKGASFTGDVKNATYMTHAAGPGNGWDVGFRVVMEIKPSEQ